MSGSKEQTLVKTLFDKDNGLKESTVRKRRRLYILPQCHVNLTQPTRHIESHIFEIFVPVLRTLCSLGLKILQRFCTFL